MTVKAPEEIFKSFTKANVHEAIGNWIATTRGKREKLQETDCSVAEILIDSFWIEKRYCVEHIERRPADEKFNHHDEQHFDNTSLIEQTSTWIRSGWKLSE